MAGDRARYTSHIWSFFRAGGFDQVRLDSGSDVAAIGALDQKLWVALACPTHGIEFDATTLDIIDTDHDGRIRASEVIAAVDWTTALLKDVDDLTRERATLPLAAIADDSDEGRAILASARTILRMLGKADALEISLQDTGDIEHIYDGSTFNGDGVVPVDAAEDEAARTALADIIACIGAVADRSGKPGVNQANADRFFAEAAAYTAWRDESEAQASAILPLGAATAEAAAALSEIGAKLDDYFIRCRIAAFDPDAAAALNPSAAAYATLASETLAAERGLIQSFPIARIEAAAPLPRPLPLSDGINPAWAAIAQRFRRAVVVPLLGERDRLTEDEWGTIKARLAPYLEWSSREPATPVATLGIDRVRALAGSDTKQKIDALIVRDLALAPEMDAISRVEKLIRLQRDLHALLNNIVSFRNFYTRSGKAVFQAGTLYLDGRSCELCVRVEDEARHALLAGLSRIYLAYCACSRIGGEKMTIAAAITAGDADNLMVGRNGIFYDRKGRDWDATIVKIIEHPISLRQAFWLPYKQLARLISDQIQKFAAARAASTQTQLVAKAVSEVGGAPEPTPKDQAFDAARFAGIFAAIGLAVGMLGTAIASLVTGFLNLAWWQIPVAVLGIILIISGPSVLIAAMKLRSRNLGPILDACGWAVNTRLRVTVPFGRALTAMARLPDGARRSLSDPYAEKRPPWGLYLTAFLVAAAVGVIWWSGLLTHWLGR